jgi:long-chain acyl-CoA synthetase
MNVLAYMIDRSARYYSERTALICEGKSITFRQVHEFSNALGRGFQQLGVKKGDRAAVLLPNSSPYVIIDFALIKGGYVRVPLNTRLAIPELEHILQDSGANTLIYDIEYINIVDQLRKKLPTIVHFICVGDTKHENGDLSYQHLIEKNDKSFFAIDVDGSDLFQILYTSGTTGRPKGAVTNVRSRISSLNNVFIDELNITPNDAMLHVASLAHGGGTKVLPHYIKGAANVLMPKFTVEDFLEAVDRYKITTTWLVPTIISMIIEHPKLKNYDYSSLKTIVYAAAPMPVATLRKSIEVFGSVFVQVYGLSEAPNPDLVLSKTDHMVGLYERPAILASAGREVTNVRVRLVDQHGKDVPTGQIGEVIIAGDHIMIEYWNLPEATAETIQDGWLYTGDMAWMDEEGFLYIVDRRKDMIISGGYNIYPREIEEVLYQHEAILEAAVIGIPDEKWGESVKACVVLRDGYRISGRDIIDYCQSQLASFKKPKSIDFFEVLPKSSNGKILKRQLRDQYWQGYDRMVN